MLRLDSISAELESVQNQLQVARAATASGGMLFTYEFDHYYQ